jgi:tetratricopeptide (TPR) repeat protein
MPSREECAKLLAYTEWHDAQIQFAMADLTSRPPYHDQLNYRERQASAEKAARERMAKLGRAEVEAALQISLAAVKRSPDDWMLHHNCAQLYEALGRPAEAIEHLEVITKMFPRAAPFQMLLGQALAAAGRIDAAIYQFELAVNLDPSDERAREGLAQLRRHGRK